MLGSFSNRDHSVSNRHRPEPPLQSQESPHGFPAPPGPHRQVYRPRQGYARPRRR